MVWTKSSFLATWSETLAKSSTRVRDGNSEAAGLVGLGADRSALRVLQELSSGSPNAGLKHPKGFLPCRTASRWWYRILFPRLGMTTVFFKC